MDIASTAISIILSIVIAVILGNGIRKPIDDMLKIFIELEKGEGDLTRRINIKSKDEIGKMAQAFNKFIASMENMVIKIKQNSDSVYNGAKSLSSRGTSATNEITEINSNMADVTRDTQSITESIGHIAASISEIATTSQSNAEDAQDIGGAAGEVNVLAQESQRYSLKVKNEMDNVQKISSNTIDITQRLGNKASEISKIIDTIKAITAQTNLLALNASIEAARAGEHGLGFGVVVSEIRKLAENNDESTKVIEEIVLNIQQMINQTIEATVDVGNNINKGTKMVETVYEQLQKIADRVSHINERIQGIATSTEEQGASTEELSSIMDNINASNSQISAAVQQIANSISIETDTIKGLSGIANELSDSSLQLKGLVNKFKIGI
jgi:methyl-accepting chemotaxis protein